MDYDMIMADGDHASRNGYQYYYLNPTTQSNYDNSHSLVRLEHMYEPDFIEYIKMSYLSAPGEFFGMSMEDFLRGNYIPNMTNHLLSSSERTVDTISAANYVENYNANGYTNLMDVETIVPPNYEHLAQSFNNNGSFSTQETFTDANNVFAAGQTSVQQFNSMVADNQPSSYSHHNNNNARAIFAEVSQANHGAVTSRIEEPRALPYPPLPDGRTFNKDVASWVLGRLKMTAKNMKAMRKAMTTRQKHYNNELLALRTTYPEYRPPGLSGSERRAALALGYKKASEIKPHENEEFINFRAQDALIRNRIVGLQALKEIIEEELEWLETEIMELEEMLTVFDAWASHGWYDEDHLTVSEFEKSAVHATVKVQQIEEMIRVILKKIIR